MFQCKDLYTLSSLSKLKLIAGNNGLHKGIRWVYKAESLSLSQWVHGGELLIISRPVSSEPNFNLSVLLKEAIHLNMSGALLLIGPNYIEKSQNPCFPYAMKMIFLYLQFHGIFRLLTSLKKSVMQFPTITITKVPAMMLSLILYLKTISALLP